MGTLVAIGAHPDDAEIHCGGTLAKFSKNGYEVIMIYVCNGDAGAKDMKPGETAKVRAKEAENSARIINAQSRGLGISDGNLYPDHSTRNILINLIRETNPDVIITHFPDDYMPDHTNTSKLVFDASFLAINPNIKTGQPACKKLSYIYFMEPMASIGFIPTNYIDISDFFSIKEKMLLEHKSQIKWMKEFGNLDMIEYIRVLSRFRGIQVGVKYAEAFRLHYLWNRIPLRNLLN